MIKGIVDTVFKMYGVFWGTIILAISILSYIFICIETRGFALVLIPIVCFSMLIAALAVYFDDK